MSKQETQKYDLPYYDIMIPEQRKIIQDFENLVGSRSEVECWSYFGCYRYSKQYPQGAVIGDKLHLLHDVSAKYKALGVLNDLRKQERDEEANKVEQL